MRALFRKPVGEATFPGDPEGYVKESSGNRHLPP